MDHDRYCIAHFLSCRAWPFSWYLSCHTGGLPALPHWPPLCQPRNFCLSPSDEEDGDCQRGGTHSLPAALLLILPMKLLGQVKSTAVQQAGTTWKNWEKTINGRSLCCIPTLLAGILPAYKCCLSLHKPKPFMLFLWKPLLFLIWEREHAKQNSINCIIMWDNVTQTFACQTWNCS